MNEPLHEPITPTLSPSDGEREKNNGFRLMYAGNRFGLLKTFSH